MKNKIAIRWFVDFEKEEKWLNEMSSKGYCMWHTNGLIYRFHKCQPSEFTFFIASDIDDIGYRFVHQFAGKSYWKRLSSEKSFTDIERQAKVRLSCRLYDRYVMRMICVTVVAAISMLVSFLLGDKNQDLACFLVNFSFGLLLFECMVLIPIICIIRNRFL